MLTFIKGLAEKASTIMLKHFANLEKADFKMKSLMDPVTVADTEIEAAIVNEIKKHYPDHAILAEETLSDTRTDGPLWIIDPLDGTNNYLHGIPNYCISIAYAENAQVQTALVCAPSLGETYYAQRGKGAFLNDTPISTSDFAELRQAMICTGYADLRKYEDGTNLKAWDILARKVSGIRRYGAAALDLCWLANGRYDAFWERDLSPWDIAAGSLIVTEAGGTMVNITPRDGNDANFSVFDGSIIATNKPLAEEFIELIRSTIKEAKILEAAYIGEAQTTAADSGKAEDSAVTLMELKKEMGNFVSKRNWTKFHNPKNLAMSISIEAAELMEIFQWKDNDEAIDLMKDPDKFQHVQEELSDILSYSLSMANVLGIDIGKAFRRKMKLNAKKYPVEKVYGKWED